MDHYQQFGLSSPPFELAGKPDSLYMSKAHREGLAALQWGLLHEPGHFTLLMGDAGSGKTTLINILLSQQFQTVTNADDQAVFGNRTSDLVRIAYVVNPKLGFEEILRVGLEQLGYPLGVVTKLELLKKFEWLFEQLQPSERIAIIVDEAQALSDETLEELRLFSNYSEHGKGHLEILLVGQPELLTRLMEPSLRQFHQRIGARAVLSPLRRDEAFEYVEHKLRESGGSTNKIFEKRALALLVDHSQGIPRQLNVLCNNALVHAYGCGLQSVTMKDAREAIRQYENLASTMEEFREPITRRALQLIIRHSTILVLTGGGLIALAGAYFFGMRMPDIRLLAGGAGKINLGQPLKIPVNDDGFSATRPIEVHEASIDKTPLDSSQANGLIMLPTRRLAGNGEAPQRAIANLALSPALPNRAANDVLAVIMDAAPASFAAGPKSSNASSIATMSPTIVQRIQGSVPSLASVHRSQNSSKTPKSVIALSTTTASHRRRRLRRQIGRRTLQSKVQLVLRDDPRFKNVRASVTQPGVVVFEGDVSDNDARTAAEQSAMRVAGVNRVINALTTQSLQWLLVQNQINQALQQNGFSLVKVKVSGETADITGRVSSIADKDRAIALVNSTAPDVTIGMNRINVGSPGF